MSTLAVPMNKRGQPVEPDRVRDEIPRHLRQIADCEGIVSCHICTLLPNRSCFSIPASPLFRQIASFSDETRPVDSSRGIQRGQRKSECPYAWTNTCQAKPLIQLFLCNRPFVIGLWLAVLFSIAGVGTVSPAAVRVCRRYRSNWQPAGARLLRSCLLPDSTDAGCR
jgi:hypothetical protein